MLAPPNKLFTSLMLLGVKDVLSMGLFQAAHQGTEIQPTIDDEAGTNVPTSGHVRSLIIDGAVVGQPMPWFGALIENLTPPKGDGFTQQCGGSFITEYGGVWLLTARHCLWQEKLLPKVVPSTSELKVGVYRYKIGREVCEPEEDEYSCRKALSDLPADDNACAENIPVIARFL